MELLQLRYFLEIARLGSVTRAADKLHVSQPALSQTIRRLEQELGMKLFEKEGRGIRLTARGQSYYSHISLALKEIDDAARESFSQRLQGNITIGSYLSLSPILPGISDFSRLYPDVTFTFLRIQRSSRIRAEDLDAVLCYEQSDSLGLRDKQVIATAYRRTLFPRTPGVSGRTGYDSLQELREEPFVTLIGADGTPEEIFSEFSHSRISPNLRYRTDSDIFKREILEAGLAVGFTNSMLMEQFRDTGLYQPASVTPSMQSAPIRILLAWRESGVLSPAANTLKDFLAVR